MAQDGDRIPSLTAHRVLDAPPKQTETPKPEDLGLRVGSRRSEIKPGYGLADIIGKDERQLITDAKPLPWCLICSLVGWSGGQPEILGTGALVGPRLVLTAGHCVMRFYESIDVIPGRTGKTEPFGRRKVSRQNYRTHPDWATREQPDRDAGALILDAPFDGIDNWFEIASPPPDTLIGFEVNVAGYPAVKPGATTSTGAADELWHHSTGIEDTTGRKIFYPNDTSAGQSGAPVFAYDAADGPPIIVGIHAYGVPGNRTQAPGARNSATRIDGDLAERIRDWASAIS